MADTPPLLNVSVDGSHLSWIDKYLAVFTQFFYWRQADGFFFDDVALYPSRDVSTIQSDSVRRPIASPYLYFYIYLFLKPGVSPILATARALGDIKKISLTGSGGEQSVTARLEKALADSPVDYFIGPFEASNSPGLVIPPALAGSKLQIDFVEQAEINGQMARIRSASVTLRFLNSENQIVEIIEALVKIKDFGLPQTLKLDKERPCRHVDIYRDDRNFLLEVEITYELEKQDGVPERIHQPKRHVSPLLPALYLSPALEVYTLIYDGSKIDWTGAGLLAMVRVTVDLHACASVPGEGGIDRQSSSLPSVTLTPDGAAKPLRSRLMPAGRSVRYDWVAVYYYFDGRAVVIGNCPDKPAEGSDLVLPARPDARPGKDCIEFAINPAGAEHREDWV
ncbi:hypothetical protein [Maricaulis sp.]|uniref:hypothetical protein n=1 Tax=Maricaulis sp. TaxID=1486257 RepID=UPI00261F5AC1|nr:hypothetical protein [Maricaulis sp.]